MTAIKPTQNDGSKTMASESVGYSNVLPFSVYANDNILKPWSNIRYGTNPVKEVGMSDTISRGEFDARLDLTETKLGSEINIFIAEQKERDKRMDERFFHIDDKFDQVDKRFDAIDKKFDAIDKKFDAIDKKFDAIDLKFTHLEEKFGTAKWWAIGTAITVLGVFLIFTYHIDNKNTALVQQINDDNRALLGNMERNQQALAASNAQLIQTIDQKNRAFFDQYRQNIDDELKKIETQRQSGKKK